MADAIRIDLEVQGAFGIAQLRVGNGGDRHTCGRDLGKVGQIGFPIGHGFDIGIQIAVAVFGMNVLFQRTCFQRLITCIGMEMFGNTIEAAAQLGLIGQTFFCMDVAFFFGQTAAKADADVVTFVGVAVAFGFFLAAYKAVFNEDEAFVGMQVAFGLLTGAEEIVSRHVAGIGMGMIFRFFFSTDKFQCMTAVVVEVRFDLFFGADERIFEAVIVMYMGQGFVQFAKQFPQDTAFVMDMTFSFFQHTDKAAGGATLAVDVFVHTAEGLSRQRDTGQLEAPEDDQRNDQR